MTGQHRSPAEAYADMVASGVIDFDPVQAATAQRLNDLWQALERKSAWRWLRRPQPVRGMYIFGDVGRGKSMLMDMFFDSLSEKHKRRVHFHAFMQDVHELIFEWRQKQKQGRVQNGDPIPPVAVQIARMARVLCFDEFQVKDIADASILGRLFSHLLAAGITVIATSNRHPDDLYRGGLHRDRFLPFIDLVKQEMDVVPLEAEKDYRLDRLSGHPVWFSPIGSAARAALDERFASLTGHAPHKAFKLQLKGRVWVIPETAQGVARLSFDALCSENRGAQDYLALAQQFHTLIIDNIPILSPANRNEAIRFVTLIDALYEFKVKLLASADAEPAALYLQGDSVFEFQRTSSRLMEMRAQDYLALPHMRPEKLAESSA
jgi:cell division protein ZapE